MKSPLFIIFLNTFVSVAFKCWNYVFARSELHFGLYFSFGWLWSWLRRRNIVSSMFVISRARQFRLRCFAQAQYFRFELVLAQMYENPPQKIFRAPRCPVMKWIVRSFESVSGPSIFNSGFSLSWTTIESEKSTCKQYDVLVNRVFFSVKCVWREIVNKITTQI